MKLQMMQSILAKGYGRSKGSTIYTIPIGVRFYFIRHLLTFIFLSHKSLTLLTIHNKLPTLLTMQVFYTTNIHVSQNTTYRATLTLLTIPNRTIPKQFKWHKK